MPVVLWQSTTGTIRASYARASVGFHLLLGSGSDSGRLVRSFCDIGGRMFLAGPPYDIAY